MSKTTRYLIAHGASVVVVRDGKRKPIAAGQGEHFSEDEITSINRVQPGALRKPVNEGNGRPEAAPEPESDQDEGGSEKTAKVADKAPAKGKGKAKAKPEPVKTATTDDSDDDGDDDEDEDI